MSLLSTHPCRLRPPSITYPTDTDRAFPLIRKLKFRPEVAPAVQQVFARTLLCPDLDTATDMARRSQLNCITLEGDEANRKGTLTGGYTDNLTLKLEAWKEFSVGCGWWGCMHLHVRRVMDCVCGII